MGPPVVFFFGHCAFSLGLSLLYGEPQVRHYRRCLRREYATASLYRGVFDEQICSIFPFLGGTQRHTQGDLGVLCCCCCCCWRWHGQIDRKYIYNVKRFGSREKFFSISQTPIHLFCVCIALRAICNGVKPERNITYINNRDQMIYYS